MSVTVRHPPTAYAQRRAVKQETQLSLTNLRDAFTGQPRSPNIVPFHMLGIVCNSSFVFKTRDIRLQKCRDLENRVRGPSKGHWKCHHAIEHIRLPVDVPQCMVLSGVVSEIFNVEKCRDLEIGVRGHSRSLKVVPFGRLCMVSYQCSLVTLSLKRTVLRYSTCK